MTSQTLDPRYLLMPSVFSKSLLVYTNCIALRLRRFVLERKGKVCFLGVGLKKKLTYITTDSGRNVCDPKTGEAG